MRVSSRQQQLARPEIPSWGRRRPRKALAAPPAEKPAADDDMSEGIASPDTPLELGPRGGGCSHSCLTLASRANMDKMAYWRFLVQVVRWKDKAAAVETGSRLGRKKEFVQLLLSAKNRGKTDPRLASLGSNYGNLKNVVDVLKAFELYCQVPPLLKTNKELYHFSLTLFMHFSHGIIYETKSIYWITIISGSICTTCVQPLSDFGGMLWLQNYALPTYRWKGEAHQGMPYYGKNEALLKIVYYYLSSMWGDQPKEVSMNTICPYILISVALEF
uniref:Uncharacterized protein n=1 Tax=Aegilops tauschii TaxID=37682 RepID=M8C074_AEGTA